MAVKDPTIRILRTRAIDIPDLVFAIRTKQKTGKKKSSLEIFEENGLVIDLKPEWEEELVRFFVKTHPIEKKNFEHVLVDPPDGILPSQIRDELRVRSPMIPTLYAVTFSKGEPSEIEQIIDYYQLLSLLRDVIEDGLIKE